MNQKETPVESPVRTHPGRRGGKLRSGGPNGGAGGRPPDEFRRRMRELVSREETEAYLEECLSGAHGPKAFLGAATFAADRGYGKPAQPITGEKGGPLEVTVTRRIVRADADKS